ncbi:MAG TPA: nuclear transport factor 2 family protein [Pyrinomonadaceae bacterium]|nr:nuclear transport factor 2 family protein [Pyrinomonadaceae bacterium]
MKLAAIFVALFVCAIAVNAQSAAEQAQIKADILKVMNDQTEAWNRGDVDAFMKGYWNSEKLRFVSGDGVTLGWQPTLDRYKRNYNSREKMGTLAFSDLTVDVLSKDAAVVLGSWALARANDNPKGKFTLIFRKMRDGWRIVHDHTS